MLPVVGYKSVACTHFPWVLLCPFPTTAATWGRQIKSVTFQSPLQVQEEYRDEELQYKGEQAIVHTVPTVRIFVLQVIFDWELEENALQVLN